MDTAGCKVHIFDQHACQKTFEKTSSEGLSSIWKGGTDRSGLMRLRSSTRRLIVTTVMIALLLYMKIEDMHKAAKYTLHSSTCADSDFGCKVDGAFIRYNEMQARQSKTHEEAVAAYWKRYGRQPPPGFNQWLSFAFENNATIIDDYDRIEADLRPLRDLQISKDDLLSRMSSAWESNRFVAQASRSLGHITVTNGTLELGGWLHEGSYETVNEILAPLGPRLPDLAIMYNWFDEPRIIPAADQIHISNAVEWEDLSRQSTWDALRRPCKRLLKAPSKRFSASEYKDICSMKPAQQHQHGLFSAPSNFHPTQTLFPMVSNCKASTMGDILVPSPGYFSEHYRRWSLNDTIPFLQKSKTVYWRGSSTGMVMLHKHWTEGHRQRFALRMKTLQEGIKIAKEMLNLLPQTTSKRLALLYPPLLKTTVSGRKLLSQLAVLPDQTSEVGFAGIFHCDDMSCHEAIDFLPSLPTEDVSKSFEHQIVADLDGEGMSGRFYRLISSGSLPLKQTVWHEWHDERVLPWVHYVPLTLELDELVPLLSWLLGSKEGQEYGKRMADEGRAWAQKSLRTVDATIYTYRLLLEYAHIMDQKSTL